MEEIKVDIGEKHESLKAYSKTLQELFALLRTNENGLSSEEVQKRLSVKNVLEEAEKEPLWKQYLEQFTEPLILLLLASAIISVIIGQWDDAISIVLAVVIVSTVGFVQEYQSEQSLQALKQYVAQRCKVLRDGRELDMLAENLVPGDIVLLGRGEKVPGDIRLIQCNDLRVDEAILTGESNPIKKHANVIEHFDDLPIPDQKNLAFMGTMVMNGNAKGVVIGTGDDTEIGKISQMIQNTEHQKTPLQQKMDSLGKQLSMFSFIIVAIIFVIGTIQGHPLLEMFNVGVSLAVAAIPEGLPIVVTVTLSLGVTRMAKRNAIIRRLPAVEALGGVNVILVDKTGTITANKMSATHFFTNCVIQSKINSTGQWEFMNENQARFDPRHDVQLIKMLKVGVICNSAQYSVEGYLGNPTDCAILNAANCAGISDFRQTSKKIEEIPFDSVSKWMVVKSQTADDEKPKYYVKGAVETILPKCTAFYDVTQRKSEINEAYRKLAEQGLRVVAIACGEDLNKLTFMGLIGITDPPRYGVKEALKKAEIGHIKVVMLTGDSKETAISVAKDLQMWDTSSVAISSQEVENWSESQLSNQLSSVRVFYRMSPSHKMKIVQAYRAIGCVVAMTGDGVNDAPALKQADIGIAMGRGADVAKENSQMILIDSNFATIVSSIEEGKAIYNNIKNFLRFQLSTSLAAISIISYCTLFGYPLPLNPMQILWINIIMDGPPAQSLGVEPRDNDIMRNPPQSPKVPVIDKQMMIKVGVGAFTMTLGTLYVFFSCINPDIEEDHRATTLAFTTFVLFQMFNAFNCRSTYRSVFQIGWFTNRYLLVAVALSILGQLLVVYVPFLQYVFETDALSLGDVLLSLLISSSIFAIDEIWKRSAAFSKEQNSNFFLSSIVTARNTVV